MKKLSKYVFIGSLTLFIIWKFIFLNILVNNAYFFFKGAVDEYGLFNPEPILLIQKISNISVIIIPVLTLAMILSGMFIIYDAYKTLSQKIESKL